MWIHREHTNRTGDEKMAWKKERNEMVDNWIWVFDRKFKEHYEEWKGMGDDRGLFCRMFEIIHEEMQNIRKVKSNFILCAFSDSVKKYEERMQDIVDFFEGRVGRDGYWHINGETQKMEA